MALDFARLATYVVEARDSRHWRQEDLADTADVSRSALQNLERGRPFNRVPSTLKKIERALGWAPGSALDIANGGEPTPLSASPGANAAPGSHVQPPAPRSETVGTSGSKGVPDGVQAAIDEGPTVATDVIEFPDIHLIVIVKAGSYSTEQERQGLKESMREWLRVQQGIRDLVPKPDAT